MTRASIRLDNSIYTDIMTINGWKDHYDSYHEIFELWNAELYQKTNDSRQAASVESVISGGVSAE